MMMYLGIVSLHFTADVYPFYKDENTLSLIQLDGRAFSLCTVVVLVQVKWSENAMSNNRQW
jgi:hypothetical protein